MNDIIVAGIGPGHPDYMLPAAARAIREAQAPLCIKGCPSGAVLSDTAPRC